MGYSCCSSNKNEIEDFTRCKPAASDFSYTVSEQNK